MAELSFQNALNPWDTVLCVSTLLPVPSPALLASKPRPQGDCSHGGNPKKEGIVFKEDQAARIGKPS